MALAGVAPSILSADFARLGEQVAVVMDAGAEVVHVDVMDGHFVPPLSMGPQVVSALAGPVHDAGGFLDVHLMVERPERHVAAFADAGADGITVHVEATPHVHYALKAIRDAGCAPGLALNPATRAESISEVAGEIDLLLCMTINPGWSGQPALPFTVDKVRRLRELIGDDVTLQVDGGMDARTAPAYADAGATLFVAASAIYGKPDPAAAYTEIVAAVADPARA